MSLLSLEAVSKRFGSVTALDGVDLRVQAGGRTAVVGPSGSGKSTLLRVVAGFEAPDAGRIRLDGEALGEGARIVPPHLRPIGLVAQDGALFPHLDVAANIGFGLDRRAPDRRARILALLDMVELDRSMLARRPHQLSGGQQQRVALARALARRPKLMLLDEPFSALDTGLRDALRRTVSDLLAAEGVAAVLVTHDQAEALSFADQVAVLREGRLVQVGPPRTLYGEPNDAATAAFLGAAILLPGIGEGNEAVCALGRLRFHGEPRTGALDVMIRPEQVRVETAEGDAAPAGRPGVALRAEFEGATSTVHIRLVAEAPAGAGAGRAATGDVVVRVPMPSRSAPPVDAAVRIFVDGPVRIFQHPAQ